MGGRRGRGGVVADEEPPINEWFHLAGVYDAEAKTATLYLNGAPVKSEPVALSPWNADATMTLGTRMVGDLDDVRVYQRTLPDPVVAVLYGNVGAQVSGSTSSTGKPAPAEGPKPSASTKRTSGRESAASAGDPPHSPPRRMNV
ncbi:LamG-like jellyroll fold domain-containing protein [Streptosporangium sp. NPDC001559]|uniref:LamG-like jellyroll fold domain-containing protein n=1 Tax=Streptosporangium sp. NPDC001559 TaxID=3366187 RepID=UPI0036EE4C2C